MLSDQNGYKHSQVKHSCVGSSDSSRTVIKKASIEGDIPQVATDLQEGASVYGVATCWYGRPTFVSTIFCGLTKFRLLLKSCFHP